MAFRIATTHSVLLMSRRRGAPYTDQVLDDGRVIVYERHDAPKSASNPSPKTVDQPLVKKSGRPTQNGLFFEAASAKTEFVRVYEKLHQGVWVYNGLFLLVDAWQEPSAGRTVVKLRLEQASETADRDVRPAERQERERSRVIPSHVKLEVWTRDAGRCVLCGSTQDLHFDHEIPYSRGGASDTVENIRILCAKHNLEKSGRIE
jgi:hypothetical protein